MDPVLNFPKHILHDILSRLPERDAARASILSKAWKDAWSTFPVLVFAESRYGIRRKLVDQRDPLQMEDLTRKRNNFLNSVESKLLRFHEEGLAIKKFKLVMGFYDPQSISPRIDHCMKLANKSGVEVLDLELFEPRISLDDYYCLPPSVPESKSLIKLILLGCLRVDKVFLNHPIQFSSLQVLSLHFVCLGDQILQNIIFSCPLIEYITLKHCSGLNLVSIQSLPNLKGVDVRGVQEVDVDAPSLEYFHYGAAGVKVPCKINVDYCRNITGLYLAFLKNITITNQWLIELFINFPLLERLELENCTTSEKIQISSQQLKVLKLISCSNLEEACIHAPKLCSCNYHGDDFKMPIISFLHSSSHLEVNVRFDIGYHLYFENLREFLQNIKPRNILASVALDICYPTDEFNPDVLQDISVPPPSIKHLQLQVFSDRETLCLPLLNGLLWCCRPAIISVKLNFTLCSKTFIQLLCEKLMGRSKDEDYCCNSGHTKCWCHGLKDVKVTCSSKKDENVVIDCETLLNALPTLSPEEEISFWLES